MEQFGDGLAGGGGEGREAELDLVDPGDPVPVEQVNRERTGDGEDVRNVVVDDDGGGLRDPVELVLDSVDAGDDDQGEDRSVVLEVGG